MNDFVLVDLDSQADAVAQHIQGWSPKSILDWMNVQGQIQEIPNPYNDRAFVFISKSGIRTRFRFNEKDEIIILRDHSTYLPKS